MKKDFTWKKCLLPLISGACSINYPFCFFIIFIFLQSCVSTSHPLLLRSFIAHLVQNAPKCAKSLLQNACLVVHLHEILRFHSNWNVHCFHNFQNGLKTFNEAACCTVCCNFNNFSPRQNVLRSYLPNTCVIAFWQLGLWHARCMFNALETLALKHGFWPVLEVSSQHNTFYSISTYVNYKNLYFLKNRFFEKKLGYYPLNDTFTI